MNGLTGGVDGLILQIFRHLRIMYIYVYGRVRTERSSILTLLGIGQKKKPA
jgi:hypothetical protein